MTPCHPPASERRATPTRGSRNPSRTTVTATFALNGGEWFPRFRSSVPAFTIMTEDTWHNRIGIIASPSNLVSTSGRTWPVGHGPRAGRRQPWKRLGAKPPRGASDAEHPERLPAHLAGAVLGLTDRQGDDGQCRVLRPTGGEHAAVAEEKVLHVVRLSPLVRYKAAGAMARTASGP